MNITSKRSTVILNRYRELVELAKEFSGSSRIKFDECGNIKEWVNTSCNCHPEYEWVECKSAVQFQEWLDDRANKYE